MRTQLSLDGGIQIQGYLSASNLASIRTPSAESRELISVTSESQYSSVISAESADTRLIDGLFSSSADSLSIRAEANALTRGRRVLVGPAAEAVIQFSADNGPVTAAPVRQKQRLTSHEQVLKTPYSAVTVSQAGDAASFSTQSISPQSRAVSSGKAVDAQSKLKSLSVTVSTTEDTKTTYSAIDSQTSLKSITVNPGQTTGTAYRYFMTDYYGSSNTTAYSSTYNTNFADADKAYWDGWPDTDSLLCWAATASNILQVQGWGASFSSEDAILDRFMNYSPDKGGWIAAGFSWWINGGKWPGIDYTVAGSGGGFFSSISQSMLNNAGTTYRPNDYDGQKMWGKITDLLESGYMVGLSIYTYSGGAHAITCWGYEKAGDGSTYLYISDSDDEYGTSNYNSGDRTILPNTLHREKVVIGSDGYLHFTSTYNDGYGSAWYIAYLDCLKRYDKVYEGKSETYADAAAITVKGTNASGRGELGLSGDNDFYSFTAAVTGTATLTVGAVIATGVLNAVVRVYDSGGATIAISAAASLHNLYFDITYNSKYYIEIRDVATSFASMYNLAYSINVDMTEAADINNLVIGSGGSVMSANLGPGLHGSANKVVSSGVFDINGTVTGTIVSQAMAVMNISSGGTADMTTIYAGGRVNVSRGGVASNTTISSGGLQVVLDSATTRSATIGSGGTMYLYQNGSAADITIASGGTLNAAWSLSGAAYLGGVTRLAGSIVTTVGKTNYAVNGQGGIIDFMVSQRTTANPVMIDNIANVSNVNYAVTVSASQTYGIYRLAGGAASFAANISLSVGSISAGTISLSRLLVYNGTLYTLNLSGANELQLTLSTAPVTDNLVIGSGGSVMTYTLSCGLTGNANQVVSGGTYNVWGTANNTTVSQSSATMIINSGGSADLTGIYAGGKQTVNAGARATNTDIHSGGIQVVSSGGVASSVDIYSGGIQTVSANGSAVDAMVNSGGIEQVYGSATGSFINNGGRTDVYTNGTVSTATVNSGGLLDLHSGAKATDTWISSGGILDAAGEAGGAYLNGTTTLGGSIVTVSSGSNYTLNAQGGTIKFMLSQRTAANDVMIDNLANISNVTYTVSVSAAQTLGEYRLAGGASAFADDIAITVGSTVAGSLSLTRLMIYNDILYTLSLNPLEQLTLKLSTAPQLDNVIIGSGGSVMSLVVSNGLTGSGNQVVSSGSYNVWGTASSTTVSQASAVMIVWSGGVASATGISSGGTQIVAAGGSAGATSVYANGKQQIFGSAVNTLINWGGITDVFSGGIASAAIVSSGGTLDLHSGAKAGSTVINSGGILNAAWETGGAFLSGVTSLGGSIVTMSSGSNYTLDAQGGTVNFMINQRTGLDLALIDNLSNISNATYTITVSADQADGNYQLAAGAGSFNQTISIGTNLGSIGTLTVNDGKVRYNSIDYRLHNDSGNLWLEVKMTDLTAPTLSGSPTATVSGYNATVSWNAANDNIGISGYYLKVNSQTYTVTDTSYVLENLAVGSYSYQLQAFDANGNKSGWSAAQNFTVRDITAPTLNGTPSAAVSYNSATISWNAANDNIGVAKYLVKVNNQTYTVNSGNKLALNNLSGGIYQYQIAAIDGTGNQSDWSAKQNFAICDFRKDYSTNIKNATTIVLDNPIKLESGTYYLSGSFTNQLNVTIMVIDKATGKVVFTGNVKNGVMQTPKAMLLSGSYQINIYSSDRGKTTGSANIYFTGSLFYQANQAQDGDWKTAPSITYGSKVDEWVGYGDNIDYRKLAVSTSGLYNFSLSGLKNGAKVTVYTINAKGTLQTVKTLAVTPKFDKAGNIISGGSGVLSGLLLTAGQQYYIGVEAPGAAKGLNTQYTLSVGGTLFDNVNNQVANNNWRDTQVATVDLKQGVVNEWVGFGDAADFFQFALASDQAGSYGFQLNTQLAKAATMTLYKVGTDKKGGDVLTAVKAGKNGLYALSSGQYVVGVVSADNGKGVKNTNYSVSVTLPDLAVWKTQSSLPGYGDAIGALA